MANSYTSIYGQEAVMSISLQLDLPILKSSSSVVVDLYKSRKKLCGYKESRRDSEFAKARAETVLFEAKKLVEELTLLIERSNRGVEFQKDDIRVLEVVKEEVSKVKLGIASILVERSEAEKEVEELRFKTEVNLRLVESLKNEIEVANEEHLLAELGKIEALRECKEIERLREGKEKEVLDLLVERNKRNKEMLEKAEISKGIENELFETNSDVEMLETQLKLVKEMERRVQRSDESMSRSNRSFERGLSVLEEVTEARKEELASVKAELFRVMMVMDVLRNEISQTKKETACVENFLRKDDVKLQRLNSKMLMAKSKLEEVSIAEERISCVADNLVGSLEKLKKNRKDAKKEARFLKEEKTVTKAETQKTKVEIDEKEIELNSKLDELEKAKQVEALMLEKLESLIENTMESRDMESEHCSTITISRFEYEYLSRHGSQAEETAETKVAAAEAWVDALKTSTKAVLLKTETLMRESGMTRVEEEKEVCRMERSLSMKRLVEGEIQKFKRNPKAETYLSPKPVGNFTPVQRGKPRRYSSVGTPTFFVIKKKKKVPSLVKFFSGRR